uniref:Uncharacterized protein n=1 Tax=Romanomermis culicivorax TaxID=13658 RepID=A0A915KHI5_ROMCU
MSIDIDTLHNFKCILDLIHRIILLPGAAKHIFHVIDTLLISITLSNSLETPEKYAIESSIPTLENNARSVHPIEESDNVLGVVTENDAINLNGFQNNLVTVQSCLQRKLEAMERNSCIGIAESLNQYSLECCCSVVLFRL